MAADNQVVLLEAIKTAFSPGFQRMVAVARSGSIGQVRSVDGDLHQARRDRSRAAGAGRRQHLRAGQLPAAGGRQAARHGLRRPAHRVAVARGLPRSRRSPGSTSPTRTRSRRPASASASRPRAIWSSAAARGYIYVPAPWWKTEYFEARFEDQRDNKKYYYKFDGDGLRYEIAEFASLIRNETPESFKLRAAESDRHRRHHRAGPARRPRSSAEGPGMASRRDFLRRALYHLLRRINERPESVLHRVYRTGLLTSRRVVTRHPQTGRLDLPVTECDVARRPQFRDHGFRFRAGERLPRRSAHRPGLAAGPQEPEDSGDGRGASGQANARADQGQRLRLFKHRLQGSVRSRRALRTRTGRTRALVSVSGGGRTRSGPFEKRFGGGSAKHPSSRLTDRVQVVPRWRADSGLLIDVRRPSARLVTARFDGRTVQLEVAGEDIDSGEIANETSTVPLRLVSAGSGRATLRAELPPSTAAETTGGGLVAEDVDGLHGWLPHAWYRVLIDTGGGSKQGLASNLSESALDSAGDLNGFELDGCLCLRDTPISLVVESIELETGPKPAVRLRGRVRGGVADVTLAFVGPHQTLPVDLEVAEDRFEASLPADDQHLGTATAAAQGDGVHAARTDRNR